MGETRRTKVSIRIPDELLKELELERQRTEPYSALSTYISNVLARALRAEQKARRTVSDPGESLPNTESDQ